MVDHTLLGPNVTQEDVVALVEVGAELGVYAVCVDSRWVSVVSPLASAAGLMVVTVCGFPTGLVSTDEKAAEAAHAVEAGAQEVDMVIDPAAAWSANWASIEGEVAAVRSAIDSAGSGTVLKVILETAALATGPGGENDVVHAALAAEAGGADFVKTSTGFHPAGGATVGAVETLARAVGSRLGVKASGGIRDANQAIAMIAAGATRLGLSRTQQVLDGVPST
jgi:deoxyribose-phosphate aldolase